MKAFLLYVQSSFDTHSKGASARKLTAFIITVCVFLAHVFWIRSCVISKNFSSLEHILIIDFSFISALLGLTTLETMQKNKINGNKDGEPGNP